MLSMQHNAAGTGAKQKREDSAAEAEQAKKSGSNSAVLHFEGRQPSEQKACSTDAVQPDSNSKLRPASAGGTKSVTRCRRSRLIKATGSYVDAAASAEAAHDLQQCKGIAKPVLGQQREPDLHQLSLQCNDTDMLSAAATLILPLVPDSQQQAEKGNAQQQNTDDGKPPEQQGTVGGDPPDQQGTDVADPPMQQGTDKDPAELQSTDLGDQPQKPCVTLPEPAAVQQQQHSLLAAPVLIPGGSSRFSTRHLKQKVDAKLPVSKATPVGLPPTPMLPQLQQ